MSLQGKKDRNRTRRPPVDASSVGGNKEGNTQGMCIFAEKIGDKTIKILKITRDASSFPNHTSLIHQA